MSNFHDRAAKVIAKSLPVDAIVQFAVVATANIVKGRETFLNQRDYSPLVNAGAFWLDAPALLTFTEVCALTVVERLCWVMEIDPSEAVIKFDRELIIMASGIIRHLLVTNHPNITVVHKPVIDFFFTGQVDTTIIESKEIH